MKTLLLILALFLSSCLGTYYISDANYSDLREEHAAVTYYDNQVYWGWYSGYYYYYGKPHYYPWHYYYNSCPPSHYTHTTHVIVTNPVNKPTHRPNRSSTTNIRTVKTNTNRNNIKTNVNKNRTTIKSNTNRNSIRTNVKPVRSTKVNTSRRRPK